MTTAASAATTAATPAATTSAGVSTVTPSATTAPLTALTAVLRIVGTDVWPFDNTQITKLTEALAATMTTITAADINTLSAVQTSSNSSRRLLTSESADVTTQLDAGSTAAVSTVATNLNSVVSAGTLATSLTSYGVSTSSISVVSAMAAAKTADTSDCTSGAINGICIGDTTSTGLATGAIIAIAVVGGIVSLVLATIIFCCCRTRWHSRAAAVEAAAVAKAQPPKQPMTPTMPEPFAVNYPQFSGQKSLPARSGSYIPPRTISKGKSGLGSTTLTANAAGNATPNPAARQ
ncbi:TPA: hypothetical protein ACH3X3_003352 [Trebouxia sp. C0006]